MSLMPEIFSRKNGFKKIAKAIPGSNNLQLIYVLLGRTILMIIAVNRLLTSILAPGFREKSG